MNQLTKLVVALAAAGLAMSSPAAFAQTFSAETQKHLEATVKNTGGDLDIHNLIRNYSCEAVEDPGVYDRNSPERRATRVPLTQVFDDLWYIGDMYVGQYILKTPSGGFVLIDTLNRSSEVDQYTMPSLESLGLGPANPLLAVIITHGHGDHDGGANRLRALFGPDLPIYIGSGDGNNRAYNPTRVDSTNAEPQEYVIGGATIVFQSTPGHTPGAMTFIVPVHQNGQQYKLMQGGRNAHPNSIAAARQYLTGTERSYHLIARYGAHGTFHVHPTSDGSTVYMQAMARLDTRNPNLFIIGNERALRAAAVWRECAAAWLGTRDATANTPVWRVTRLAFAGLQPQSNTVTAQLTTGWGITDPDDPDWGALAGQTVTFSVDRGDGCTAVTDSQGIATCQTTRKLVSMQTVTATYAGSTATPNYVDLATTKSAVVPTP